MAHDGIMAPQLLPRAMTGVIFRPVIPSIRSVPYPVWLGARRADREWWSSGSGLAASASVQTAVCALNSRRRPGTLGGAGTLHSQV